VILKTLQGNPHVKNILLLFLITFVFRIGIILYYQFDGLYGQDAYAYDEWSAQFYNSIINFHIPPAFYWPVGYFIFNFLFSVLTAGDTTVAGLLLSLNAGSLISVIIYFIAFELLYKNKTDDRKKISFYSGLIASFTVILTKSSIVVMSDTTGLLFASLSVLFLIKYFNKDKSVYLYASSCFFFIALMTRYANVLMTIPLLFYYIYSIREQRRNLFKEIKKLIPALLVGIIVFLPQLYYISKQGITYFQNNSGVGSWPTSWSPLNFFRNEFHTVDGTMIYKLPNFLYFASFAFHPVYLSIGGLFFVSGIILMIKNKEHRILFFNLSWIMPFYLFLAGTSFQSLRYTMNFLPAAIIILTYGIYKLNIKEFYKKIIVLIIIISTGGYGIYHVNDFIKQKEIELSIVRWINAKVPESSGLFTFEVTGAVKKYCKTKPEEFYFFDSVKIDQSLKKIKGSVYFILPAEKIKTQWRNLTIEKTFDHVMEKYKPHLETQVAYYTVYVLEGGIK
jgi:hypothetical protein